MILSVAWSLEVYVHLSFSPPYIQPELFLLPLTEIPFNQLKNYHPCTSISLRDKIAVFFFSLANTYPYFRVSHLEELCFWLFLIGVSLPSSSWFRSWYFRAWAVGSVCAMVGMPLTTWLTRGDAYRVSEHF